MKEVDTEDTLHLTSVRCPFFFCLKDPQTRGRGEDCHYIRV